MDAALLFFALIWHALGGRRGSGATGTWGPVWPEQAPIVPSSAPPEWPQVVPIASLPTFPGAAWEYDEPPPREVQARAGQLVQQLWARGKGAFRIEQTAGRWIAYRAEVVASGKQGVVAYRLRQAGARPAPRTPPAAPRVPTAAPAAAAVPPLRFGEGLKPQPPSARVRLLQQALNVAPADGRFGPGTLKAVQAYQRSRGLTPDGVVGPQTQAALLADRTVRA